MNVVRRHVAALFRLVDFLRVPPIIVASIVAATNDSQSFTSREREHTVSRTLEIVHGHVDLNDEHGSLSLSLWVRVHLDAYPFVAVVIVRRLRCDRVVQIDRIVLMRFTDLAGVELIQVDAIVVFLVGRYAMGRVHETRVRFGVRAHENRPNGFSAWRTRVTCEMSRCSTRCLDIMAKWRGRRMRQETGSIAGRQRYQNGSRKETSAD